MPAVFLMAPGLFAGAESVVLHGARAASDAGLTVEIWLLQERRAPQYADDFQARAKALGVATQLFLVQGRLDLSAVRGLRAALGDGREWILHAHGYKALFYAMLVRPKARALIATHHGETAHNLVARIYGWLERFLLRRCDQVIAVSSVMAAALLRAGIPSARLRIQRNPLTQALAAPRRRPPLAGRPIEAVFIGRLSAEKGLQHFLPMLAAVKLEIHLTIVGSGALDGELRALCDTLGLGARVRFAGYQTEVERWLRDADLLVLPSEREGLPLTLIEALAMGVPALASAVGATAELVNDGENGRLLPPRDAAAWQAALSDLPRSLGPWQDAAYAGAEATREAFGLRQWALTLKQFYEVADAQN